MNAINVYGMIIFRRFLCEITIRERERFQFRPFIFVTLFRGVINFPITLAGASVLDLLLKLLAVALSFSPTLEGLSDLSDIFLTPPATQT